MNNLFFKNKEPVVPQLLAEIIFYIVIIPIVLPNVYIIGIFLLFCPVYLMFKPKTIRLYLDKRMQTEEQKLGVSSNHIFI